MPQRIRLGVYEHYKGQRYLVIGRAHDSNEDERIVVVYVPLYKREGQRGPQMAIRTESDFLDWVDPTNGESVPESVVDACQGSLRQIEAHGYVPRFQFVGE